MLNTEGRSGCSQGPQQKPWQGWKAAWPGCDVHGAEKKELGLNPVSDCLAHSKAHKKRSNVVPNFDLSWNGRNQRSALSTGNKKIKLRAKNMKL